MSKSISRSERTSDGVQVVSNDRFRGLQNELWNLNEELGLHLRGGNARVFWAGLTEDQTDWDFNEANVVYYETEVLARDLKTEEKEWCNDTFMYGGDSMPDEVYCFTIPKPKKLIEAIKKNNLSKFENLEANIEDGATRAELAENFQQKIAHNNYRVNQLGFNGYIHNIDPEWNPEHTDSNKKQLREKARMRSDSYKDSWEEIFNLSYYEMKKARYNALSLHEPRLSASDPSTKIVELDVIGEDDKSYCRYCGSVQPESNLIDPRVRGYDDRTVRVCENCAERRRDFTEQSVAVALDKRAVENGGQRRLNAEFLENC